MTHQNDQLDQALSRLYEKGAPESFETGWRAAVRREETIHRMKPKKTLWMKRMIPALAALVDAGNIEAFQGSWLDAAADKL